jgi:hypothetical protein
LREEAPPENYVKVPEIKGFLKVGKAILFRRVALGYTEKQTPLGKHKTPAPLRRPAFK